MNTAPGALHGWSLDRVSVPSPIAIDILMDTMARDRAHVLVFSVNLKLWEIILFTLKSNYYVHIAVSGLQYTYAVKLNCFYKPGISFVDNYGMLKVCLYFKTG